jgi:hypothetical protein
MKDQILKIAKVKSEKEFYKKYPTEAAFMKAHGKAFQKAAMGKTMVAQQLTQLTDFANPPQAQVGAYIGGETYSNPYFVYGDFADEASANVTGVSAPIKVQNVQPSMASAQQNPYDFDPGTTGMKNIDWEKVGADVLPQLMGMKKGGSVPKLQIGPGVTPAYNPWGPNQPLMGSGYPMGTGTPGNPGLGMYPIQQGNNPVNPPIQQGFEYDPNGQMGGGPSFGSKLGSGVLNNAGNILQGINMLKDEKKQKQAAKQSAAVTGVVNQASGTRGEISKRRYFRPEDMRFDPYQMNKPKGEGTDYLQLQDGGGIGGNPTEIQNTYAPNTIYTNLEYEPLRDNNIKQYKKGGKLTKAQVGAGMAGQLGGGLGSLVGGGKFNQAGGAGKIGSTLGGIAGSIIPGVGTVIGSAVGGLIGGALGGKSAKETARFQEESKNNIMSSALQQGAQSIQGQNSAFMQYGGNFEYPKAQAGTIAEKSVGKLCELQKGMNKQAARENAEALRVMGGYEKEAAKNEKIIAAQDAAALAGEKALTHDWMGSLMDKAESKEAMNLQKQFFKENANVFIPDDTSGYTPQQKYAIASKLKQKISTPVFGKNFQQQFGVDPRTYDLQRIQSEMVPKMGGWEGTRNYLFNKKEYGGWVSHDWQPQVIASFGEYKMEDLLKPPHDADMLRAGGHLKEYTPPSERAMETFDMGGELQTHWGGYTEPASENPYLPDGGVTYMPRGNYHSQSDGKGNTGIGITFGDNPVEVERGEPMVKLQDGGTGENNLVVLGALDIPDYALMELNKDAKGKKFKTYGTELTKNTNKQNKMIQKATEKVNDLEVLTPFDNLEMNSLQAQILGGNMKLKDIASETENIGRLQQAIHDSAKEFGYSDVAKFNKDVKANKVQFGNSQPDTQSAQRGGSFKIKGKGNYMDYNPLGEAGNPIFTKERYDTEWIPKVEDAFSDPTKASEIIKAIETYTGQGAEKAKKKLAEAKTFDQKIKLAKRLATDKKVGVYHDIMNNVIDKINPTKTKDFSIPTIDKSKDTNPIVPITITTKEEEQLTPGERFGWQDAYNTVLPYLRPSNQLELDSTQLAGEMYALANNQVEPVFAQSYKPMLSTPFDISLQDQLNANQADYNATQKLVGYNPAALAQLNAQKYSANSSVLGQQTRLNQAEKARVYEANRNILNDAQLKNIGIYDQQMVRQSQALSNTKAQTQAALNSISDKYSRNKLENRTLGVYENLYNYRYDNRGRAININPLVDFQAMIDNASPNDLTEKEKTRMKDYYEKIISRDKTGNITGSREKTSSSKTAKNGNIVKAIKNL